MPGKSSVPQTVSTRYKCPFSQGDRHKGCRQSPRPNNSWIKVPQEKISTVAIQKAPERRLVRWKSAKVHRHATRKGGIQSNRNVQKREILPSVIWNKSRTSSARLTLAPPGMRRWTIACWPLMAASCRAVLPNYEETGMVLPFEHHFLPIHFNFAIKE